MTLQQFLPPGKIPPGVIQIKGQYFIEYYPGYMYNLSLGDWIIRDDSGSISVLSNAEFLLSRFKVYKDEVVFTEQQLADSIAGGEIIKRLLKALKESTLTNSERRTLLTYCAIGMNLLTWGEIQGARLEFNALATTTLFTAARKTFILNTIDAYMN